MENIPFIAYRGVEKQWSAQNNKLPWTYPSPMQTQALLCFWPAVLSEITMCQSHYHVTHQTIWHITPLLWAEHTQHVGHSRPHIVQFILKHLDYTKHESLWTLNLTPGRTIIVYLCQNLGPWNHKRKKKRQQHRILQKWIHYVQKKNLIQHHSQALIKWSWNVQDAANGDCPSAWSLLHQTERNAGVLDSLQKLNLSQINSAHWCQPARFYQITRNPFLNTM